MTQHCDPGRRHDFVLLFDVKYGNPNGDPDCGNLPRVDPETMHGIVTDVALKRRVRDYVATVYGQPIFIQSQSTLNALYYSAAEDCGLAPLRVELSGPELFEGDVGVESILEGFSHLEELGFGVDPPHTCVTYLGEAKTKREFRRLLEAHPQASCSDWIESLATQFQEQARKAGPVSSAVRLKTREELCRRYFDIRVFGAVLTAGFNAGQLRGAMQLTFARSMDPILPIEVTVTRSAVTRTDPHSHKETEIGRKACVPYALYQAHGFFNPYLAKQVGVCQRDLEMLWSALANLFELDRSASRGEMAVRGLYVFTHDSPEGRAHAHRLFDLIQVDANSVDASAPRRSASEYFDRLKAPRDGPLRKFPGVTLTTLVDPRK